MYDTLSFVVQKLGLENSEMEIVDESNKDDLENEAKNNEEGT